MIMSMNDSRAAIPHRTIAILSHQCLVRMGVQKILESSATLPMIMYPHTGRTADLLRAEHCPDVFILDLETERDAVATLKHIRKSAPTSKIVLLCGLEDKNRTCEAFAAGVDGIILKVQPPAVVLAVIESLYASAKPQLPVEQNGERRMDLFTKVEPDHSRPAWPEALTEREREIIRLVGQGLSNKDIAHKLSISDSTVRHHMTSIFDKVGVPNRQKLLVHAHHLHATPL